jgi:hypothetical protein
VFKLLWDTIRKPMGRAGPFGNNKAEWKLRYARGDIDSAGLLCQTKNVGFWALFALNDPHRALRQHFSRIEGNQTGRNPAI